MREKLIQAIKDLGENQNNFFITEADLTELAEKDREYNAREYSSREYHSREPNISVKYIPTGITKIFPGGNDPVTDFKNAWNQGNFKP